MADLVMGSQTVLLVDDRHARKNQTLAVKNVIERDRRKTLHEVAVSASCSKSNAQRVLTADLGLLHVSTRLVPRLLIEE